MLWRPAGEIQSFECPKSGLIFKFVSGALKSFARRRPFNGAEEGRGEERGSGGGGEGAAGLNTGGRAFAFLYTVRSAVRSARPAAVVVPAEAAQRRRGGNERDGSRKRILHSSMAFAVARSFARPK